MKKIIAVLGVFGALLMLTVGFANAAQMMTTGDNIKIGGSSGNPIIQTVKRFDETKETVRNKMGRGRVGIVELHKKNSNVIGKIRLENHHRSRGWTLYTKVTALDADGNVLASAEFKRGLRPKGFSGYKRAEKQIRFNGIADKIHTIVVVSQRKSTKKFVREALRNIVTYQVGGPLAFERNIRQHVP